MSFTKFIFKRILGLIFVVLLVVSINFFLIHMAPGDVANYLAGREASQQYIETIRREFGLDKPLFTQFTIYLDQFFHGNLGYSYTFGRPVISVIASRIPATLTLVGISLFFIILIGTFLGAYAGMRYPSITESLISNISFIFYSMPTYWLGLLLVLIFGVYLKWFPISGMATAGLEGSFWTYVLDRIWHLVLPVATLVLVWFGEYVQIARASIMEIMNEPFITTARSIGYKDRIIFFKHALRNAMLPIVTMIALHLGLMVGGALFTEIIFSWPGMGRLIYEAMLARDYPLLLGTYTIMAISVAVANIGVDVIYSFLDPRIKLGEKR